MVYGVESEVGRFGEIVAGKCARDFVFSAIYADDKGSADENRRFWDATPGFELKTTITNPEVDYEVGRDYYIDWVRAPLPIVEPRAGTTPERWEVSAEDGTILGVIGLNGTNAIPRRFAVVTAGGKVLEVGKLPGELLTFSLDLMDIPQDGSFNEILADRARACYAAFLKQQRARRDALNNGRDVTVRSDGSADYS